MWESVGPNRWVEPEWTDNHGNVSPRQMLLRDGNVLAELHRTTVMIYTADVIDDEQPLAEATYRNRFEDVDVPPGTGEDAWSALQVFADEPLPEGPIIIEA
jgi:hypothetical protein